MIQEDDIVYGTIIQEKGKHGRYCKIVGGKMIDNEKFYLVQLLPSDIPILKNYIEDNCEIVRVNPLGIKIGFDKSDE